MAEVTDIVHLEDDPVDGELIGAVLAEWKGHAVRVRRVANRTAFLSALAAPRVDIVLSDFRIPGFDGEEALDLALRLRPDVPFVFVSGAIGEETAIDLVKRGATDYVIKDRLSRLLPAIERALLEAQERAQRRRAETSLRFLSDATAALAATLDPPASLATVARLGVAELFAAIAVDLHEPHGPKRVAEAYGDGTARDLPDPERAMRLLGGGEVSDFAVLPLPGRRATVGALVVACREGHGGERDLLVAREIAARMGSFVENARLFEQTRNAMRVREELLAIVSHDLRNPLAAVMSAASVLERSLAGPHPGERWLQTIRRSVDRMERLIKDLLELAAIEADRVQLQPSRIAVSALLSEAVDLFRVVAAERGIALDADCDASLEVECDRERMLQVLSNLIGNALKFTRTRIRIRAHPGDPLVLSVEDDGPGIPPDQLPHLFERYWRADRERRGIGLGLAIVKGLVEAHGGRVHVSTKLGAGSEFRLTLPGQGPGVRAA